MPESPIPIMIWILGIGLERVSRISPQFIKEQHGPPEEAGKKRGHGNDACPYEGKVVDRPDPRKGRECCSQPIEIIGHGNSEKGKPESRLNQGRKQEGPEPDKP